jgi:hypothetical protein
MTPLSPGDKEGSPGALQEFWRWWWEPRRYSKTDPRAGLILIIVGICLLIFAPTEGRIGGAVLLWYIGTVIVPALWGQQLAQRFGSNWGLVIAYAPLWVPIVLGLTAGLWLPLFGIPKKAVLPTSQASPARSLTTTPAMLPRSPKAPEIAGFITLVKPVSIQTVSGTITLEAGLSVPFVSRDGDNVRFHYGNTEYEIPVDATDLAK